MRRDRSPNARAAPGMIAARAILRGTALESEVRTQIGGEGWLRRSWGRPKRGMRLHARPCTPMCAHASQVVPVTCAFGAFGCVLASYFLLVPIREEAGILLGEICSHTSWPEPVSSAPPSSSSSSSAWAMHAVAGVDLLPKLFTASLVMTLMAAPATSLVISTGKR